jgi:dihydroflavonol-4-reductase
MIPRDWAMAYDHAEDIAQAHLKAIEEGAPGEEYIISSQARTMVELLECAEEITGIPAPRPVPDAVFATLATVMRNVERVTTPPEGFESEALELLAGRQWYVDNSKAKRELGVEFRSLEEGLRDYLPWELDQLGMEMRIEQPPTQ